MTPQSLFQFGTVSLHPTPDRRVIRLQTALGEQFFDIAQRERVAKIPAHGTQNQLRRRLPPLENCRSGCVLAVVSSYQPTLPGLQHILPAHNPRAISSPQSADTRVGIDVGKPPDVVNARKARVMLTGWRFRKRESRRQTDDLMSRIDGDRRRALARVVRVLGAFP
jgi:hypothetical protein